MSRKLISGFIFLLVVMLTACNQDNDSAVGVPDPKHQSSMHYSTKQHAPVDLRYEENKKIILGQAAEVKVTFVNHKDTDVLIVKQLMDEGLVSQESSQEYRFGPLVAGSETELVLHFIPRLDGLFYIRITAILVTNGNQQARGFAIPIEVGNLENRKPSRSTAIPDVDSTKQGIISMPARETSD